MSKDFPRITLEAARVNAHLTQSDAAAKIGVSRATLQSYERGDTVPNWDTVGKIGDVYHFPVDYIFFGK